MSGTPPSTASPTTAFEAFEQGTGYWRLPRGSVVFDVEDDQGGSDDFPIHGLRLMLRSALKVILSRAFLRSPIARRLLCTFQPAPSTT
jgi:hypothetical protein